MGSWEKQCGYDAKSNSDKLANVSVTEQSKQQMVDRHCAMRHVITLDSSTCWSQPEVPPHHNHHLHHQFSSPSFQFSSFSSSPFEFIIFVWVFFCSFMKLTQTFLPHFQCPFIHADEKTPSKYGPHFVKPRLRGPPLITKGVSKMKNIFVHSPIVSSAVHFCWERKEREESGDGDKLTPRHPY